MQNYFSKSVHGYLTTRCVKKGKKNQPIRIQKFIKFYLGKITPEPALGVVVVFVARTIGIAYSLINKKGEFK